MAEKAKFEIQGDDQASPALRNIKRELQALENAAKGGLGSFTSLIGAGGLLAGAAVFGAVALRIKETVNALDDLADTAPGLGLLATELSAFRLTAQAAGVDAGKFDQSITRLNQRITDAAAGGKDSIAIFEAMGVQFRDVDGRARSTADILRDVADRFSTYRDGAEKSALATELLGRSGAKFIAWLSEGREGLDKFGGASDEAIRNAARLQGQMDKLSASWEKFWISVAGNTAGAINAALDAAAGSVENAPEKILERLDRSIAARRAELAGRLNAEMRAAAEIELRDLEQRAERLRTQIRLDARSLLFGAGYGERGTAPIAETAEQRAEREKAEREAAAAAKRRADEAQRALEKSNAQQFADMRRIRENRAKLAEEVDEANQRIRDQALALEAQQSEAARRRLEAFRESIMSEQELETARYEGQLAALQTALLLRQTTEEEYRRLREEAELQHQARMGDIEAQGVLARRRFAELNAQQQASAVLGTLTSLTAGVANQNRVMFNINKVASIAETIVNSHAAAARAMRDWPYPINIAIAGLTYAAGLARVNAIRSAQFGTATSAPSIGGGGATPVTPAQSTPIPVMPAAQAAAAPPRQSVNITLQGSSFSAQQVRELIEQINEQAGLGVDIVIARG